MQPTLMFDLIIGIIELLCGLLNIGMLVADIYAWIMGRENRVERKTARRQGLKIPPRDRWNRRVIALSVLVLVITTALVLWRIRRA